MRFVVACCATALMLSGCAASGGPTPGLPPTVGNGLGSQYGNYAAQMDGEMRGPSGERCVVFNWDRPLTQDLVLRLRSASCESPDHPGRMVAIDLSRTVVPISASNLKDERAEAPPRAALSRGSAPLPNPPAHSVIKVDPLD